MKIGGCHVCCCVISLPMRNWNATCLSFSTPSNKVISLPMRNWNCSIWPWWVCSTLLLVYLWGIETYIFHLVHSGLVMLLVYLWGIETQFNFNGLIDELLLLVYLWGIETLFGLLWSALFFRLLVYLWGIETGMLILILTEYISY